MSLDKHQHMANLANGIFAYLEDKFFAVTFYQETLPIKDVHPHSPYNTSGKNYYLACQISAHFYITVIDSNISK